MGSLHYMQIFQMAMILLCAIFLAIIGTRRESAITKNLIFAGILVMLQNVGYYMILSAQNLNEAKNAVRIEYMGTSYIVTFMMTFVLQFCKRELKNNVLLALIIYDTVVLLCVQGCRYVKLYYSSMDFSTEPLNHLILGHGPLYMINMAVIVLQMIYAIYRAFQTWRHAKTGRYKKSCIAVALTMSLPLLAYVASMTGIFFEGTYDPVPATAAITVFLLGMIILIARLFDGQTIAYANIIRKLKEPVILVDKEYRFVEANDRAAEVFPSLETLKPGDAVTDPMLLFTLQNERCSDIISDDFIMRPDVQKIIEKGEMRGYAVLLADLTEERRQLEESQQLKLEAEIANKAKSDFLAQMSHEIRTPINAVLGMNEMILRECESDNIKRYAMDIKNSAHSLLSIINEILDLAKIESGRMELIPANYALSSVLNDLYNMMIIRAKEKNLELNFDVQKDIPCEYFGDDIRLRQIVNNLLTNAIKYTDAGSVTFSIRGGAKGNTAYLRFSVTDTGVGIRKEDIDKLFEKYSRIDESQHRQVEGTGLGMSITIRLLHLMGSTLKVSSTYGKGSCFYFDLHQRITNTEPIGDFSERVNQQKQDYQWSVGYQAPDASVLIVDDNSVNRKVFINLLKQTNMKIEEASGGREAIDMICKKHYDLIFLDHMMPEMDGIETLHALEEVDLSAADNAQTPIIMLTANAVVGAEEKYMQEGFSGFLTKPIIPEKLDAAICHFLPEQLLVRVENLERVPQAQTKEKNIDLQPLDEFEWEAAMNILQDEAMLVETLRDFMESLPNTRDELSLYMDSIENHDVQDSYRICVHGLKSSAATVGAILLSKLARLLEEASADRNLERIYALHPILMEEIQRHYERLFTLFPEDNSSVISNDAEMWAYLAMLRGNLDQNDLTASDMIMRELMKYSRETKWKDHVLALKKKVDDLEFESAAKATAHLMVQVKGGTE
ncbi:MAG: response regulator [Eubacterium sp.]|nr:response regulator [Eubacterium sp.]